MITNALDVTVDPQNTRGWPKSARQLEWAKLYVLQGMSALDAAVQAGYRSTTARSKSYELARRLQPFLVYLQQEKNAVARVEFEVTAEKVLGRLAAIGFANIGGYFKVATLKGGVRRVVGKSPEELTPEQAPAVKGWTVVEHEGEQGTVLDYQYAFHDPTKALVALGKHLALFDERIQLHLRDERAREKAIDYSAVPMDVLEESLASFQGILDRLCLHGAKERPATIEQ